jgi:hypothetical protein
MMIAFDITGWLWERSRGRPPQQTLAQLSERDRWLIDIIYHMAGQLLCTDLRICPASSDEQWNTFDSKRIIFYWKPPTLDSIARVMETLDKSSLHSTMYTLPLFHFIIQNAKTADLPRLFSRHHKVDIFFAFPHNPTMAQTVLHTLVHRICHAYANNVQTLKLILCQWVISASQESQILLAEQEQSEIEKTSLEQQFTTLFKREESVMALFCDRHMQMDLTANLSDKKKRLKAEVILLFFQRCVVLHQKCKEYCEEEQRCIRVLRGNPLPMELLNLIIQYAQEPFAEQLIRNMLYVGAERIPAIAAQEQQEGIF